MPGFAGWCRRALSIDDPVVADRLAQFEIETTGLCGLARKLVEDSEAGTAGPADASIVKLYYSELLQRMTDFGAEMSGLRRAYRTRQAAVERMGIRLVGAGFHRLVGMDDPRRVQRDPAHHHRRTRSGTAPRAERDVIHRHIQKDIHNEFRSVAADLLSKNEAAADWSLLAEAGWVGLEAPEDAGGAGVTFAEVAVILEEMGRAAAPTSYLGGAVLSVGTLIALQPNASRDGLLTDVAAGAVRTAVVLGGIRVENDRLAGRAAFVPDAECADRLLVIATDPGGTPVVVVADGLTVTPQPVLDQTRRLAEVTADGVAVSELWRFDGDPAVQVRRLADRAAVAVACDSLGLADAMLAATVSYAKVRTQFGRPIGSFQAVKHACADMLVRVRVARQLVTAAVEALTTPATAATPARRRRWRSATPAPRRSTSQARPCSCTAGSATRGRAASMSTSNARCSTGRCSALPPSTAGNSRNAIHPAPSKERLSLCANT